MMKIGILTFFRPVNHGAIYQACASSNIVLKKYADEIELIDYELSRTTYYRKIFRFHDYLELVKTPKRLIRRFLTDLYYAPTRFVQRKNFDKFVDKYLNVTKPCSSVSDIQLVSSDYDTLVVGSDLVWNTEMTEGINPIFYLKFAKNNQKKVSFAASVGMTVIPENVGMEMGRYLDEFDYVSVREKTAEDILKKYTNSNIYTVLDPTLITKSEDWIPYMKHYKRKGTGKYMLVYMLEFSDLLVQTAKKIAEENNWKIVTFGSKKYFGKNAEDIFHVGPDEMLSIIKNSESIITNSFHGCAFSIIFGKEFWCVPHSTRGTRMTELMGKLGLEARILTPGNIINKDTIKYDKVYKKLKEEQENTMSFLEIALGDKHERNM